MKHIVFDVDGTLIDTEYAVLQSFHDTILAVMGRDIPTTELTFALGIPGAVCLERLQAENIPETLALWERNMAGYSHTCSVFPGIRETLEALTRQGHKLGIVTSKTRAQFRHDFLPYGIEQYFGTVICADDTPNHKPAPDPLLKYAELAGADISDVVYVGDSPYDMACAKAAGAKFILAGWGDRQNVPADTRAETPAELAGMIQEDSFIIRLANQNDAEQLDLLNREFNGPGEATLDHIRASLLDNRQEVVIVAEERGVLAGFVCVQLKRSFCYDHETPEITEVYVKAEHRNRGVATSMISFAEDYCSKKFPLHKFELLTGKENFRAQALYGKLGYGNDGEIHLSKRIK